MRRARPTRDAWIVAGAWATLSALALAARPWLPMLAALLPSCPLHALAGVPCMACGSTRAALHLASGDAAGAFLANPLATAALLFAWLGGWIAPLRLALGWRAPALPGRLSRPARAAVAAALVANWCFLVVRGI